MYASSDCTGQPMIMGGGFIPILQVIGDTVFVPGVPAAPQSVGSRETIDTAGGCASLTPRGACCHTPAGMPYKPRLATTTTLDALGIVPPRRAIGPSTP